MTSTPTLTQGLYGVSAWENSSHFNEGTSHGDYGNADTVPVPFASEGNYYGEYYAGNPLGASPSVAIAGTTSFNPFVVTVLDNGVSNDPRYTYSFSFDSSLIGSPTDIDIFWSVNTSANDVIAGNAPVPIPGAIYLLGSGVLALLGIRRKTK